ncbi:DUF2017 domain-containing protein [Leifsonia sp. NPDC058292]|uniref:DUF2017 domain-containing protein n=1 Tax=Leifsonia sp. NPDC058292 TaxID=3346428 RepID=UPI0036DED539
MRDFRRERDGAVCATFAAEEVEIIVQLAGESAALADTARRGAEPRSDPALIRLLPDAYPGDAAASAEFRRFTTDGLAGRKAENARTVIATLATPGAGEVEVRLDDGASTAWLQAITDIRLVIAARLGIVQDGDDGDIHDEQTALLRAVYDWLAYVQDSLVGALRR